MIHASQIPATAAESAAPTGSCRKPPEALYGETGKRSIRAEAVLERARTAIRDLVNTA
jgi:hypothetical protein